MLRDPATGLRSTAVITRVSFVSADGLGRASLPVRCRGQFVSNNPLRNDVISMGAHRHGQEGSLAPLWKCCTCKVFFVHSSYSKTLSRRIITYALFLQPIVGFWGQSPRSPHGGSIPGPRCVTFVSIPLICPPLEKSCGRPR